ncbi:FAD-binding oxidoreductase [Sandaracinus amylolyticus]|uniref:Alkyldihydroxyacetonephosphate synthase n=1 Tax=Sandaracinus amylolyticus TaxID=927083 RepID=A0A0F6YNS1_9BACT|nr:FAD-binding oxidoreductase [Sandaracinus amylolyticus]AKF10676.1 Alkyldihydroxyacetonephosphate synthase [Sandaracinus amylolyticus]
MRYARERLRWNGWGSREVTFETKGRDREVWDFVRQAVGADALPSTPPTPLDQIDLPAIRLSPAIVEGLGGVLSPDRVRTDAYERAFHALGRSYHDLLRLRRGDLRHAPDAVVYPESAAEVLMLLSFCEKHDVAVVPFGGGSSVVGGVEARGADGQAGVVTLDTTRMDQVLEVDPVSHTATAQSGIYGPVLEEELAARGFTVGHFPQSFEYSTLGGWIAARGAGQLSNRYGTADKLLVAAKVATPRGEWRTLAFPASAAGPNLNHLVAGSEGTLGVITEATVKIHPVAESRRIAAFVFRDFETGAAAVRALVQGEVGAAMIRLSDADETRFFGEFRNVIEPHGGASKIAEKALSYAGFADKCVMMVAFEGGQRQVREGFRRAFGIATRAGGLFVGESPGKAWWKRRFEMPYLRDPMMDHGVGVDTLETSTEWANVPRLYRAVREALAGAMKSVGSGGVVMTHVSHSYLDGASLYFTFVFARDVSRGLESELAQWKTIKEAASRAISEHGGTISHHHGVGIDHAHWLPAEKGTLGIDVLSAAKAKLDPKGVMNPGKLVRAGG